MIRWLFGKPVVIRDYERAPFSLAGSTAILENEFGNACSAPHVVNGPFKLIAFRPASALVFRDKDGELLMWQKMIVPEDTFVTFESNRFQPGN